MKKLEICCYTHEDALIAQQFGADRLELCSGRNEGGLTPSYGQLVAARKDITIPVHPIIRPRCGDFHYSASDITVIKNDLALVKELGFPGVVIGVLTAEGQVDIPLMKQLLSLVEGLSVTFHRAFDVCADPWLALAQLTDLGIDRILTSGQMPNAPAGLPLLLELSAKTTGPIIMPGAGIRPENITQFKQDVIKEVHSSATHAVESAMTFRQANVSMSNKPSDEFINYAVSGDAVAMMKAELNR